MSEILVIDSELRSMEMDIFSSRLPGFDVTHITLSSGRIDEELNVDAYPFEDCRAIYHRIGHVGEAIFEAAPRLELVAAAASGYDHIDVDAATEYGVIVTHTPDAPAPGVVEHTIGFMLSMLHEFPEFFEETAGGNWMDAWRPVTELGAQTVGVVGLGTIGSRVATALTETFSCEVVAYDPYVMGARSSPIYPRTSRAEIEDRGISLVSREALFERSDIVTVHTPLTSDTEGMVSTAELAALEDGYLINTSRGPVVDEAALIEAVEAEQLAGVALDVMRTEPPNADNPLLGAPNVYITPHVAGVTTKLNDRSARINAERIKRTLAGETPDNVLNPAVLV